MGDLVVLGQSSASRRAALLKVSMAGAVTALGGVAGYFLDANQVPYEQEPAGADRSTADVASLAKDFTALVICRSR